VQLSSAGVAWKTDELLASTECRKKSSRPTEERVEMGEDAKKEPGFRASRNEGTRKVGGPSMTETSHSGRCSWLRCRSAVKKEDDERRQPPSVEKWSKRQCGGGKSDCVRVRINAVTKPYK